MVLMAWSVTGLAIGQEASFLSMGIGRLSCATWLQSQASEAEGSAWLLGFWTGMNANGDNHKVGLSTDALGVIGEVKLRCQTNPSTPVIAVASGLFTEFDQAGH